jgi:hypothetical protein
MPVPAIGAVATPANFQVASAQGVVQLSWAQVPLATIYYINRSTDNVSFTNIASSASLSYSDSTGTVGSIYYYQVQAGNGTYSSVATASQPGLSLLPGQTTAGNVILEAQQRCNKENSQFYTAQELMSMCSQSYKELYDQIIAAYGEDYYVATPYTYTTGQNLQLYPLPSDFYKMLLCEVALNPTDPNSYVTLREFMFIQKNLYNYPNQYTMYGITNIRYRINGNNLMIVPQTQGGQTIRIWYAPRPNQLLNLTDTLDGISGWEEYVVVDMCIKMLAKQEDYDTIFAAQKMGLIKRLEEMAKNRNLGEPQTVSDSRYRNFSWGDPGDGWNGQGM